MKRDVMKHHKSMRTILTYHFECVVFVFNCQTMISISIERRQWTKSRFFWSDNQSITLVQKRCLIRMNNIVVLIENKWIKLFISMLNRQSNSPIRLFYHLFSSKLIDFFLSIKSWNSIISSNLGSFRLSEVTYERIGLDSQLRSCLSLIRYIFYRSRFSTSSIFHCSSFALTVYTYMSMCIWMSIYLYFFVILC